MDVFADPMEEVILEVLLYFQVHHPSGALKLDLIESAFQPHGKGGDLLSITLGDRIEVLHKHVEGGYHAKNNGNFLQDMGNASGRPHVPGHICCYPL